MAPPTYPATGSPQRVPGIVGRESEQAALRNAQQNLLNGDGGLVLIDGEAGIGKTTLMRWLAREAEAAGARVLWGHAYDNSITPPYGLWTGLAKGLTDAQAAEQLVLSTARSAAIWPPSTTNSASLREPPRPASPWSSNCSDSPPSQILPITDRRGP